MHQSKRNNKYKDLIGNRKIYIDSRAMIIQEKHRKIEKSNIKSGSTFKGCGAAYADKIMRKQDVILAKEYFQSISNEFKDIIEIADTALLLNQTLDDILIEGAQGQDLDINHGLEYPNVTSRMCKCLYLISFLHF